MVAWQTYLYNGNPYDGKDVFYIAEILFPYRRVDNSNHPCHMSCQLSGFVYEHQASAL